MPKNFEITDEIAALLRDDLRSDRFAANTECPMSEKVIAHALEELDPGVKPDVAAHIASCRICADLAQDVRFAAEASQQQDRQPLDVLPALARALNRSTKPLPFGRFHLLLPKFRVPPIYLRIAGAIATACLVFVVIQFGFRNVTDFGPYPKAVEKMPAVRKKVISAQQTGNQTKSLKKTTNGSYSINSITNDRQQQTDPFEPFLGSEISPSTAMKKRVKRVPLTPLEKLDLSQLKLVGIILSDNGNKAMIEDAAGKGYVLKEDTYIGRNSGKVTRILKDKVIIEEEMENNDGRLIIFQRELKLNKQ